MVYYKCTHRGCRERSKFGLTVPTVGAVNVLNWPFVVATVPTVGAVGAHRGCRVLFFQPFAIEPFRGLVVARLGRDFPFRGLPLFPVEGALGTGNQKTPFLKFLKADWTLRLPTRRAFLASRWL